MGRQKVPEPSASKGGVAAEVRRRTAFAHSALTVLLDKAGGRVEFTEAEYQRAIARYGGASQLTIQFEVVRESGRPDVVVARLERRAPANAELPT